LIDKIKISALLATKSIKSTENEFGRKLKVVRVMPNTPALVGEGMSALCSSFFI
jgi:pyrroline-5-carboxylate reductase